MTIKGKIVFRLANVGSKSEGVFPYLLVEDGSLVKIAFIDDNPFENTRFKEYESKDVILEGEFNENKKFIAEKIEEIRETESNSSKSTDAEE